MVERNGVKEWTDEGRRREAKGEQLSIEPFVES